MDLSLKPPDSSVASELIISSQNLKLRIPIEKLDLSFTQQDGRQIVNIKAKVDTEAQSPPCPATTFHKFKKLPLDIQQRIWKLSFQEPRIFCTEMTRLFHTLFWSRKRLFPSMKNLIFILEPRLSSTDIVFSDIDEDKDIIFDDKPWEWKELKELLAKKVPPSLVGFLDLRTVTAENV
ncbi:unnamed protein product [Fusarium langsethiae]|nr:unnamed protein product [Fusarium langsethiae]